MSIQSQFGGDKEGEALPPPPAAAVTFSGPCPFCGRMIAESGLDPCSVRVITRQGKGQTWSCHAACFKDKMAANPFLNIAPEHF